jgi:hypothetical protein
MKDKIGNRLMEGQMVQVIVPAPHALVGQIVEVVEAHDLVGFSTPGRLRVLLPFTLDVLTDDPIQSVIVVRTPSNNEHVGVGSLSANSPDRPDKPDKSPH